MHRAKLDVAEAIRLLDVEGLSRGQTAERLDVSLSLLKHRLRESGYRRRKPVDELPDGPLRRALHLVELGEDIGAGAASQGFTADHLEQVAAQMGVAYKRTDSVPQAVIAAADAYEAYMGGPRMSGQDHYTAAASAACEQGVSALSVRREIVNRGSDGLLYPLEEVQSGRGMTNGEIGSCIGLDGDAWSRIRSGFSFIPKAHRDVAQDFVRGQAAAPVPA